MAIINVYGEMKKTIDSQNKRYKFYVPCGDIKDVLWDYAEGLEYDFLNGELELDDVKCEIENRADGILDFMWENFPDEFKVPYDLFEGR